MTTTAHRSPTARPGAVLPYRILADLEAARLSPQDVLDTVARTLDEDLSWGPDVTTGAIFDESRRGRARVVSRAEGCLAGVPVAAAALHLLAWRNGNEATTSVLLHDGSRVIPGDAVLVVEAPLRDLLTAERTMLNLLGQLSGVATATAAWADALEGSATRVRDTRKTVPGLRVLQKYAVRCGGGVNHRMGLGDAALIKDNHIAAAGSVAAALEAVRAHAPGVSCEVEADTLDQVREAVAAGARLVLLDNMAPDVMTRAVAICRPAGVATEASGGLALPDAPAVGATGVDYVAVGALTHSAPVLDLGLDMD
ncbi:carboxylating nicotinate-nucleotide diphosphorylase [Acidipropionibacterium virtanenii]|uniref:Nicotinate-nucleotide pyrophosphorylase [carboxylating] n=1 Tax=Acidipropionibacterium virtanenii TaxID=2057246 RepID=A0A344UUU2_9ACTN|nr:carboxylating nicotinate-nucleotide diphosphorylase [Acidipropionibacterium virtanenii]AXE39040.1 Nicotinate-nucleotide pyrophosphorylase [carboxylating] [Acidipropionibacterium virtanenii]